MDEHTNTPRLDEAALDAIEARWDAATTGPWLHVEDYDKNYIEPPDHVDNPNGDYVAFCSVFGEGESGIQQAVANAAAIAHAREDVPALLAECRALRAEKTEGIHKYADLCEKQVEIAGRHLARVDELKTKIDRLQADLMVTDEAHKLAVYNYEALQAERDALRAEIEYEPYNLETIEKIRTWWSYEDMSAVIAAIEAGTAEFSETREVLLKLWHDDWQSTQAPTAEHSEAIAAVNKRLDDLLELSQGQPMVVKAANKMIEHEQRLDALSARVAALEAGHGVAVAIELDHTNYRYVLIPQGYRWRWFDDGWEYEGSEYTIMRRPRQDALPQSDVPSTPKYQRGDFVTLHEDKCEVVRVFSLVNGEWHYDIRSTTIEDSFDATYGGPVPQSELKRWRDPDAPVYAVTLDGPHQDEAGGE